MIRRLSGSVSSLEVVLWCILNFVPVSKLQVMLIILGEHFYFFYCQDVCFILFYFKFYIFRHR